tara:strand:+ start:18110 stop:18469 length:360 start_codon:yes stop_codon:yes gene_type:complete
MKEWNVGSEQCEVNTDELDGCIIEATPEDAAFTVVKIVTSASTGNPKYAATYGIESTVGDAGRLLVGRKYRNFKQTFDDAFVSQKTVPVIVFGEKGLARPFTKADKLDFIAKLEGEKKA